MTKRILMLFLVLAALILPAAAATKAQHRKHSAARSGKSKSVRKSTRHRTRSSAARKRPARSRAAARPHKTRKP
jgi:hypothetical protein